MPTLTRRLTEPLPSLLLFLGVAVEVSNIFRGFLPLVTTLPPARNPVLDTTIPLTKESQYYRRQALAGIYKIYPKPARIHCDARYPKMSSKAAIDDLEHRALPLVRVRFIVLPVISLWPVPCIRVLRLCTIPCSKFVHAPRIVHPCSRFYFAIYNIALL